eukprot:1159897-Pelagomonas_calceolata.AAC.2
MPCLSLPLACRSLVFATVDFSLLHLAGLCRLLVHNAVLIVTSFREQQHFRSFLCQVGNMHQQQLQANANQRATSSSTTASTLNSRVLRSIRIGERPVFRSSSSFCKQGLLTQKGTKGEPSTTPHTSALCCRALPPQEEERQRNERPASKGQQEEASTSSQSHGCPPNSRLGFSQYQRCGICIWASHAIMSRRRINRRVNLCGGRSSFNDAEKADIDKQLAPIWQHGCGTCPRFLL